TDEVGGKTPQRGGRERENIQPAAYKICSPPDPPAARPPTTPPPADIRYSGPVRNGRLCTLQSQAEFPGSTGRTAASRNKHGKRSASRRRRAARRARAWAQSSR